MIKTKIFLVDNHQILLDGLCAFLEKDPQLDIVGAANSGEQALACLEQQRADVVILDLSMPPGMDGIETAKRIKRRHPNTKIILLTMHGEGRFILKALRLGVHGYVIKEKSKETLIAAIRAVLNGNRYFSPDLLERLGEEEEEESAAQPPKLTKRETDIICLMVNEPGFTAEQIGDRLSIAAFTVQTHIRNAKAKLGLSRSLELVKYAMEHKLCGG